MRSEHKQEQLRGGSHVKLAIDFAPCERVHFNPKEMDIDTWLEIYRPSVITNRQCAWIQISHPPDRHFSEPSPLRADRLLWAQNETQKILHELERATQHAVRGQIGKLRAQAVERLLNVAGELGETCGKWMLMPKSSHVDAVWATVARDVCAGLLDVSAKVSPRALAPAGGMGMGVGGSHFDDKHVICVYVNDFRDKQRVRAVLRRLLQHEGLAPWLTGGFKPDFYTYADIYSGNKWRLPPTIYQEMVKEEKEALSGQQTAKKQERLPQAWARGARGTKRASPDVGLEEERPNKHPARDSGDEHEMENP